MLDPWPGYLANKDKTSRDKLLVQYLPLVHRAARGVGQKIQGSVEQNDLVSYGVFGLLDALEKFDPERGVKFEAYALLRIRGAIFDEIRSMDWIPRWVRERKRDLEVAYQKLQLELARKPTTQELMQETGFTKQEVLDTQNLESALDHFSPLHQHEDEELPEAPENHGIPSIDITIEKLTFSIKALGRQEQKILILYYYEGLGFNEIAQVLGLAKSRVSTTHSQAVDRLIYS
ncbi:MAG: FliA/WhiG family RNA polymerase sigma factor [Ilumatobacteraceae bacterium]